MKSVYSAVRTGFLNKAYWSRDAQTVLTFNNCTLCPHCIYVFCIYLRKNSDLCHLQHKLIGFYNWNEKCLQRGTDWAFKYSSLRFVFKRLIDSSLHFNKQQYFELNCNISMFYCCVLCSYSIDPCRSQRPRGLRRRSAAAHLLRLWVRIPPGGHGCLSLVSVVCCQVVISATSWSLFQKSPTDCGASLCVIPIPHERGGHSLLWAEAPK